MGKNWDKEHLRTLSCRLRTEEAEAFQAYATSLHTTANALLAAYVHETNAGVRHSSASASSLIKQLAEERDQLVKENEKLKKVLALFQ